MQREQILATFKQLENGCWEWTRGKSKSGYGIFWNSDIRYYTYAHVYFYESRFGIVNSKMEIHHKCQMKSCVNPDHLVALSPSEHIREAYRIGERIASNSKKTHCSRGHEYLPETTYTSSGRRKCKICAAAYREKISLITVKKYSKKV